MAKAISKPLSFHQFKLDIEKKEISQGAPGRL